MTSATMSQHPPHVTVQALRQIGLFGALGDDVLQNLSETLQVRWVDSGAMLFLEGEDGREMHVVLQGEVEVLKKSHRGTDVRVALLGPGDWFGEMSIVDIQPRSASVRALAPSGILRISAQDLDQLYRQDVKSYAIFVLNLARELSRRLRVADAVVADLLANVFETMLSRRPPRESSPDCLPKV